MTEPKRTVPKRKAIETRMLAMTGKSAGVWVALDAIHSKLQVLEAISQMPDRGRSKAQREKCVQRRASALYAISVLTELRDKLRYSANDADSIAKVLNKQLDAIEEP